MNNYFAMFTDEGNAAVADIVRTSRANGSCWLETYQELCYLADKEGFGEATDTVVREMVYDACGFQTTFYV